MTKRRQKSAQSTDSSVNSLVVQSTAAESLVLLRPVISKDGKYLLCCCGADVNVYSVKNGTLVHTLKGHRDLVTDICINPLNQFQVISSSLDGTLRKWNFEDGVIVSVVTPEATEGDDKMIIKKMLPLLSHKGVILYLVKKSGQKNYYLIKQSVMMEKWYPADIHKKSFNNVIDVAIGGKGSYAAVITKSQSLYICSMSNPEVSFKHTVTKDPSQVLVRQCLAPLTCLAAHPTEDCVAVGHQDGKINIW